MPVRPWFDWDGMTRDRTIPIRETGPLDRFYFGDFFGERTVFVVEDIPAGEIRRLRLMSEWGVIRHVEAKAAWDLFEGDIVKYDSMTGLLGVE
jgi:hypothetical protein